VAEIGRIVVQDQPRQKVREAQSQPTICAWCYITCTLSCMGGKDKGWGNRRFYPKINKAQNGWGCGSSDRKSAEHAQGPKPQYCQKQLSLQQHKKIAIKKNIN
jgi:hypothetical protein